MIERPPLTETLSKLSENGGIRTSQFGSITQATLREMGYSCVDFSLTEQSADQDDYWSTMHSWCRTFFEDRYTWTGHLFWFDRPEDAYNFKVQWVFAVMEWAQHFPYAIRAIPEEHTQHWQTDRVLTVANELRQKYHVKLNADSFLNGRWLGLQDEQDAMYARLLLPTHEFVDLRNYGPALNEPE